MKRLIIALVLFSIFPLCVFSLNFGNGVHLVNLDDRAYTLVYTESGIPTTKICRCIKSVPGMKNGLDAVRFRKQPAGFRIISVKPQEGGDEITAVVYPGASVDCLGIRLLSFEISGAEKIGPVSNGVIEIRNGKLFLKPLG